MTFISNSKTILCHNSGQNTDRYKTNSATSTDHYNISTLTHKEKVKQLMGSNIRKTLRENGKTV